MMSPFLKKRIRTSWRRFKYVIYVYLGFVILAISMGIWNSEFTLLLEEGGLGLPSGFVGAWFPSLWEDILFFGTAFVSLIVTTTLARDEHFNSRVSALANGMSISPLVERRLRNEVEKLLSYNKHYKVKVVIREINRSSKYIRIISEMECRIENMCDDLKVQSYVSAYVEPDRNVAAVSATPLGNIHHFSYTHKRNKRDKKTGNIVEEIEKIVIFSDERYYSFDETKGKPYSFNEAINIHEDGFVDWKLTFQLNMSYGGDPSNEDYWYYSVLNGYTEKYQLTLVNETNESVNFTYDYNKHANYVVDPLGNLINTDTLTSGETKSVVDGGDYSKGDTFGLYFS